MHAIKEMHALAAPLLCLWCLPYTNIWKGSKQSPLLSGANFLLSSPHLFSFSCLSQFCIRSWLLSADWLAHLSEDKVHKWGQRAHACASESGNTWDHMQTQACTLRHLTCTKPHTQEGEPDAYTNTHTHTSTHIQSPLASCLPTVHLINPYVSLTKQERTLSSLWTLKLVV